MSCARSEEMSLSLHNEQLPGIVAWWWSRVGQSPGLLCPGLVVSLRQLEAAVA